MAPEIRFTPEGIPYLVEFSNISFRAGAGPSSSSIWSSSQSHLRAPPSYSTLPSRSSYRYSTTSSIDLSASDDASGGLYIHFPSRRSGSTAVPTKKTSPSRLVRLKRLIGKAVLEAGMDTPQEQKGDPLAEAGRRMNVGANSSSLGGKGRREGSGSGALFSGTYGQVVTALTSAGLAIAPCGEGGFEYTTRLGALFVVNHTDQGVVEFRKLTLWA